MRLLFVNNRLAFGSALRRQRDVEKLQAVGITHVLNLRCCESLLSRRFRYFRLGFHDNGRSRPAGRTIQASDFYRRAMKHPDGKLFVMCHHGMCRSPSLTHFLLRASGASSKDAERPVLTAKPRARLVRAYRQSAEEFLIGEELYERGRNLQKA